jgi:alpha-tubulin suppressor-like RCC1 family protein
LHTCALTTVSDVVCWGYNSTGQLGDGTTTSRPAPVLVTGLSETITAVSVGAGHTCALTDSGRVLCWGVNTDGQLGTGATPDRHTPTPVAGLPVTVVAVAAGGNHTCALLKTGGAMCWGANDHGQLGDGSLASAPEPVPVSGLPPNTKAIAAGGEHGCAITGAGGVACWGWNGNGQLGDGTSVDHLTAMPVKGLSSGVTAIAAGALHTCAVTTGGKALCWGSNSQGQLGDGTTTSHSTPVAVSGAGGFTSIATGATHTCAKTSAGAVWCWGDNNRGDLGDGTSLRSATPVAVSGLSPASDITAGNGDSCAVTTAGHIECWGANFEGQLGYDPPFDRVTPVEVTGF